VVPGLLGGIEHVLLNHERISVQSQGVLESWPGPSAEEIEFDKELKKHVKERSQLHRILANETWVFREEYALTADDTTLTTELKAHTALLGREDLALEEVEHRSFKLKMGALDPETDTARVCAIAEKLAGSAGVRVDLNARWDLFTSKTFLPQLAAAGVELIEQPVPGEQVEALAEISAMLPIPVMADESLRTPVDATWGSELFEPLLFAEEILVTPLRYTDGALHLPDGPGLGVELDLDAVAALRRTHLTREEWHAFPRTDGRCDPARPRSGGACRTPREREGSRRGAPALG